jgi:hypothetical protein
MNLRAGCRIALVCVVLWPGAAAARTWKDSNGRFSVEAEFVKVDEGIVYLKRTDTGKTVRVPLERLSAADRRHVIGLVKAGRGANDDPPAENPAGEEPTVETADGPMIAEDDHLEIYSGFAGGKLVAWFNNGCDYVVSLNMKLPHADGLRTSLRTVLARDKKYRKEIVLIGFSPQADAPTPIEVAIGNQVPLAVAQAVLAELAELPDFPLAITLETQPDDSGSPRHVTIGSIRATGKQSVPPETLKRLLDPQLTHPAFLQLIESLK